MSHKDPLMDIDCDNVDFKALAKRERELTRVETLALVWPGTLIHSRLLSSNLNLLKFFMRVGESFVLFGRAREFEREFFAVSNYCFFLSSGLR